MSKHGPCKWVVRPRWNDLLQDGETRWEDGMLVESRKLGVFRITVG